VHQHDKSNKNISTQAMADLIRSHVVQVEVN
jgi:hypothetical protein